MSTLPTLQHNCPMFNTDLAKELIDGMKELRTSQQGMIAMVAEIKTKQEVWLGNGRPGQIPVRLEKIEADVAKHERLLTLSDTRPCAEHSAALKKLVAAHDANTGRAKVVKWALDFGKAILLLALGYWWKAR